MKSKFTVGMAGKLNVGMVGNGMFGFHSGVPIFGRVGNGDHDQFISIFKSGNVGMGSHGYIDTKNSKNFNAR